MCLTDWNCRSWFQLRLLQLGPQATLKYAGSTWQKHCWAARSTQQIRRNNNNNSNNNNNNNSIPPLSLLPSKHFLQQPSAVKNCCRVLRLCAFYQRHDQLLPSWRFCMISSFSRTWSRHTADGFFHFLWPIWTCPAHWIEKSLVNCGPCWLLYWYRLSKLVQHAGSNAGWTKIRMSYTSGASFFNIPWGSNNNMCSTVT